MRKTHFPFLILFLLSLFLANIVNAQIRFDSPRLGIVIDETSYKQRWGITQMTAHGWAGIANLAGIPYDCLFLADLPKHQQLSRYTALVLAQCSYVEEKLYPQMISTLKKYLSTGGHLIIDGPLAIYDESAQSRKHADLDSLLGIEYIGFKGDSTYRIKISSNDHYITRSFAANQFITQHLVNGLNILNFKTGQGSLLIATDEKKSAPFLSVGNIKNSRVLLISDLATWAGAASFFRNNQPQVFYANQLINVLIRALQWVVYGDVTLAIPVPQVSNANLTAIIRLDADASSNLDAQIQTISYLERIAGESGVVPVYAWVSSSATKAGWQDLAPLGEKIEDTGGEIGTHSKFHHIDREMNEQRWKEELDDAIQEIEFNTADFDFPVGKVECFINPGNTIYMENYEQIARRFIFYMTHGFEQDMPVGYGNMTWFTGPYKNLVILEDTPSPDYQWFYDPTWSYTTAQITAYQEAIFDHMFDNIGRGIIYNQMWHDYSITSQPQYGKSRIMNKNNLAMYDAIKTKFATCDIYCPTPLELTHKLQAMAQWDYSWESSGNEVRITLDLSPVRVDTVPNFIGGMGLKLDNTGQYIQQVTINNKEHFAFADRLIILPDLQKGKNTIEVQLGSEHYRQPHLTYISKHMPAIRKSGDDLIVSVLTRSKARLHFYGEGGYVLLNADGQENDRDGDHLIRGTINSDRKVVLKKLKNEGFKLIRCSMPLIDCREKGSALTLVLTPGETSERTIFFQSEKIPKTVIFNSKNVEITNNENKYLINLPEFKDQAELIVSY
jgi:uncharacterized membrane protein